MATRDTEGPGSRPRTPLAKSPLRIAANLTPMEMNLLIAICAGREAVDLSAQSLQSFFETEMDETVSENAARTRLYRLREKLREMESDQAERLVRAILQEIERSTGTYQRYSQCGTCKTVVYLKPPDYRGPRTPRGFACPACDEGGCRRHKRVRLVGGVMDADPAELLDRLVAE